MKSQKLKQHKMQIISREQAIFCNSITMSVNKKEAWMVFLTGCLMGAVLFIVLYGTKILNFTYVDWIYVQQADIFQHQIGFEFIRNDIWRFPLGSYMNYAYPFGTSVVYTDSIPLFAIIFKLFAFLLPQSFQYFGLWGILCLN